MNRTKYNDKLKDIDVDMTLPMAENQRLVKVFVEGYEDVSFWRSIFDHYTNPQLCFEISVPTRSDLPKGKKILMGMIPRSNEELLLCVDSDFDYIFDGETAQSRELLDARFMFHTYAYATENYLCYAPSLHNVCVKATKNDTRIFDFEYFLSEYSSIIYPLFLWYSYSAKQSFEHMFVLADFRAAVRLGYLEIENNGENTLEWLRRGVEKTLSELREGYPDMVDAVEVFAEELKQRGVTPQTTYLYMHGHTLMDSVVMVVLNRVCEQLRNMSISRISNSSKRGVALDNELSNYKNSLRSIRDVLLDNENYTDCPLYKLLEDDIERYIQFATRRV